MPDNRQDNKTVTDRLEALRDGEDELYFGPATGELIVGRPPDRARHPDAVTATTMAREGFFAPTVATLSTPARRYTLVDDEVLRVGPEGESPLPGPLGVTVDGEGVRIGGALLPTMVVDSSQVFDRNRGVLESGTLAGKHVLIVGLGSGGSSIALDLAKSGVGRFTLVDMDRLETHNVGRHACDLGDLGRRKTLAVRDLLYRRNPAAVIDTLDVDILDMPEEDLAALIESSDLVVVATDSNASRFRLNRLAVQTRTPAVFGRAYLRACGGDALRVRADGPCYSCMVSERIVSEEVTAGTAPAYSDRPLEVQPGLAVDIAPISWMCTRLALQALLGAPEQDGDLRADLYIWANRREHQFSRWEPMDFSVKRMTVNRWYGVRMARRADCPVCNEEAFLADLEGLLADA